MVGQSEVNCRKPVSRETVRPPEVGALFVLAPVRRTLLAMLAGVFLVGEWTAAATSTEPVDASGASQESRVAFASEPSSDPTYRVRQAGRLQGSDTDAVNPAAGFTASVALPWRRPA